MNIGYDYNGNKKKNYYLLNTSSVLEAGPGNSNNQFDISLMLKIRELKQSAND